MSGVRETILGWIEQDRDELVGFLSDFVRVPSPNPPGDTRAGAAFLHDRLQAEGVPVEYRTAKPEWPNVVGTFTHRLPFGSLKDVRLIFAGKVYPVGDIEANTPFRVVLDEQKVENEWAKNAGNLGNPRQEIFGSVTLQGQDRLTNRLHLRTFFRNAA